MMAQTLSHTFAYCGKDTISESQQSLLVSYEGNMLCYDALNWREWWRIVTAKSDSVFDVDRMMGIRCCLRTL